MDEIVVEPYDPAWPAKFAAEQNVKLEAIARMSFGLWKPSECPLCKAGAALEKVSDASPTAE